MDWGPSERCSSWNARFARGALPRRYVYVVNVYVVNSGASDGLSRRVEPASGARKEDGMNRGLIGTIIGVLVIIILVIVILQLT